MEKLQRQLLVLLVVLAGCAAEGQQQTVEERCEQIIETVAACYPGVAFEAECTEETLAKFEERGYPLRSRIGYPSVLRSESGSLLTNWRYEVGEVCTACWSRR